MLVEKTQPIYSIPSIRNYRWSVHLDLLRGLAAILVLLDHMRFLLFVDYSEITNPTFFNKRFYFFTGLGHQSVMIFFVLSGFFISASVIRTIKQKQWSWVNYLITRLTRLYIVLIPALFLTAFWDLLGIKIFGTGQDSFYGEKFHNNFLATYKIWESLTWQNFLGTIGFVQKIFVNEFGSDKAVWSLAYEFWYYILFPAIILCVCVKSLKLRVLYGVLSSAILLMVGSEIRLYFIVWLMGALVSIGSTSRYISRKIILNLLIFFSTLTLVISLKIENFVASEKVADFIIGIATAVLIYFLANDRSQIQKVGLYEKFAQGLAGCSYTLYLVHLPILCFIRACIIGDRPWEPDVFHVLLALGIVAFVFLYAVVIYYFTEAKTDKLRKLIMSWVKSRNLNQA
ncbi:acyltransferase [Nostoc sp. FACHB-152]|uniref:acyltransferase family protein n=1 Tax=unclassified Nostoc TaxID=2593658 RepID=UPI001681DAE8|nr:MULTISPECIES: acyltransferase [unclassified Nostoc]MBD2449566.1 acyltransferase [Nostoc sp. FACHB-152]MBD2470885.1 acyltransferase [Nostoc sp. FACHB-145]